MLQEHCVDSSIDSFLRQHGQYFSSSDIKKNSLLPFKDHAQLATIVDVLSRKHHHHIVLHMDFPKKWYPLFLEALLHHLTHDNLIHHLRQVELFYLPIENFSYAENMQRTLTDELQRLHEQLTNEEKYIIFAITNTQLLAKKYNKKNMEFIYQPLKKFLSHPKCRFLLLTSAKKYSLLSQRNEQFDFLAITKPSAADVLAIIKKQRSELENFHQIIIPEELLSYAYSLTERYLSTQHTLEKTLLLLDSSAARASAIATTDTHPQLKPVLTTNTMLNVLSDWTHIPVTHLSLNKFKLSEFIHGLQQRIFGQNAALEILSRELQQSQAHLQKNSGPFCSLLFAGPEHCGKKTTARALAEELFKQSNMVFFTQPAASVLDSLLEIKLQQCVVNHRLPLKKVISETPHAIILFENVEQFSPVLLDGLCEILSTGHLYDDEGKQYNFSQAIVILSTTIGANQLLALTKRLALEKDDREIDLMQLVQNEQKQARPSLDQHYSPQELVDEIMPEILAHLPPFLCKHSHLVPFLGLTSDAIENIIRFQLKSLTKMLDTRYEIEFAYAPEIIPYLSHEVLAKTRLENQPINIHKTLRQLCFTIEQTIMNPSDNRNYSRQLFLQLNEHGQMLRCDWIN